MSSKSNRIKADHSRHSNLREKIIEHVLIGELLRHAWLKRRFDFEISRPEVDRSGFDLIIEARGVIRHVQLKSSIDGGKTASQHIQLSLGEKPSGCVVWTIIGESDLTIGPYLFFGSRAGQPLPDISKFPVAKHTKRNADGVRTERPELRVVTKRRFEKLETIDQLFLALVDPKRS